MHSTSRVFFIIPPSSLAPLFLRLCLCCFLCDKCHLSTSYTVREDAQQNPRFLLSFFFFLIAFSNIFSVSDMEQMFNEDLVWLEVSLRWCDNSPLLLSLGLGWSLSQWLPPQINLHRSSCCAFNHCVNYFQNTCYVPGTTLNTGADIM